ncbi:MAG: PadR family transcriptional regulator [Thermoplasmata archaeon]|nr:PadR family transcriptional regulator [Thermoplasmata archaeon]
MKERLMKGIISILITKELVEGPLHGYALEKRIEEKTGIDLPTGMIYVILKSLEKKGCIKKEEIIGESKKIVKKYSITDTGRDFLFSHKNQLIKMKEIIDDILKTIEKEKP